MPNRTAMLMLCLSVMLAGGCDRTRSEKSGKAGATKDSATAGGSGKLSGDTETNGDPATNVADGIKPSHEASVDTAKSNLVTLPIQPHWQERKSPVFDVTYMGDPGDVYYTRQIATGSMPDLSDIDAVRQHYRKLMQAEKGGILKVDVQKVQGRDAIVSYCKQVVDGIRGYRYVARCVIPCNGQLVEVRMDAIQMGPTGLRESMATMKLGANIESEPIPENAPPTPAPGRPKSGGTRIKGFFFDPYDAKFNDIAINSLADDPKLDSATPQHPLSRIRKRFPKLLADLNITPQQ